MLLLLWGMLGSWGGIQEAPNFQKCSGHILQHAGVKQHKCEISHTLGTCMEMAEVHKEQTKGFILITSSFQSTCFFSSSATLSWQRNKREHFPTHKSILIQIWILFQFREQLALMLSNRPIWNYFRSSIFHPYAQKDKWRNEERKEEKIEENKMKRKGKRKGK